MKHISILLALLGVVLGAVTFRDNAKGASTPPFGSDLPNKAFVVQLARDEPGVSIATPTPTPTATAPGAGLVCGQERWAIKTLSDSGAGSVNFTPQSTTVDALRALAKPSNYPDSRIAPVEMTTYTVQVALLKMKTEADRDIHLVVADPSDSSHTMIDEFPDVECAGAINSAKKTEMQTARAAFEASCGSPTTSFKNLSGTATITGVGFWDIIHGQTGVAPNGIEIHPVLAFSGGCTTSGPTATPIPTTGGGVTITSISSPIARGSTASLSAHTSSGASCTIKYVTPSGNTSTASGLGPKTADGSGNVSWSWTISCNTNTGAGSVTVTCDGQGATTSIVIT